MPSQENPSPVPEKNYDEATEEIIEFMEFLSQAWESLDIPDDETKRTVFLRWFEFLMEFDSVPSDYNTTMSRNGRGVIPTR